MQRDYDNYDFISREVIRRFTEGDNKAYEIVMNRYANYLHRCFVGKALGFKLNPQRLDMENLKQEAWVRFAVIMQQKFKTKKRK
jgi:hypothetical protein